MQATYNASRPLPGWCGRRVPARSELPLGQMAKRPHHERGDAVFDSILRRVPWFVAAVMVLAVTGQAALAGTDDGIGPSAVANVNADRVDGRHAVKYTSNTTARKGKLMAFGATGYLPSNIVQGGVATVAALQSATGAVNEADNPVHWNQLQGVPTAVLQADTTRSAIVFETPVILAGAQGAFYVAYPVGLDLKVTLIPTAPGAVFYVANNLLQPGYAIGRSADGTGLLEAFVVQNTGGVNSTVKLRATVWNDTYLSPSAVKDKVEVTFYKKLPDKYRP